MTPPEHFLIGVTCANIFYSFLGIFKKYWYTYINLFFIMGLMAIIPDIDSFTGNYTSTDPMIGHRGMTHSFAGVAVLSFAVVISVSLLSVAMRIVFGYWKFLVKFFKNRFSDNKSDEVIWKFIIGPFFPKQFLVYLLFAFIAGSSHLFCDLPQPPSVWKGIPLFFPFKDNGQYARYGGWNLIGWYDIKIQWVLIGSAAITLPFIVISRFFDLIKLRIAAVPLFSLIILFNALTLGWITKYISNSAYEGEAKWYAAQMKIVEKFPPEIREATLKGKTIFISLFRQAMGYK